MPTTGGSVTGRWQTHVNTVESFTVGVRGDSAVRVYSSSLGLSAERVRPLALHPELSFAHVDHAATADDLRVALCSGSPTVPAHRKTLTRRQLVWEAGFTPADAPGIVPPAAAGVH